MTLATLCPDLKKIKRELRRKESLRRRMRAKAMQIEAAWRDHEKAMGLKPRRPFWAAVEDNVRMLEEV